MPYIGAPGVGGGDDALLSGLMQQRQISAQERMAQAQRPHWTQTLSQSLMGMGQFMQQQQQLKLQEQQLNRPVMATSSDGTIMAWWPETGEFTTEHEPEKSPWHSFPGKDVIIGAEGQILWSPREALSEGQVLAETLTGTILTGAAKTFASDTELIVIDTATGIELNRIQRDQLPKDAFFVTDDYGNVSSWDVTTGTKIADYESPRAKQEIAIKREEARTKAKEAEMKYESEMAKVAATERGQDISLRIKRGDWNVEEHGLEVKKAISDNETLGAMERAKLTASVDLAEIASREKITAATNISAEKIAGIYTAVQWGQVRVDEGQLKLDTKVAADLRLTEQEKMALEKYLTENSQQITYHLGVMGYKVQREVGLAQVRARNRATEGTIQVAYIRGEFDTQIEGMKGLNDIQVQGMKDTVQREFLAVQHDLGILGIESSEKIAAAKLISAGAEADAERLHETEQTRIIRESIERVADKLGISREAVAAIYASTTEKVNQDKIAKGRVNDETLQMLLQRKEVEDWRMRLLEIEAPEVDLSKKSVIEQLTQQAFQYVKGGIMPGVWTEKDTGTVMTKLSGLIRATPRLTPEEKERYLVMVPALSGASLTELGVMPTHQEMFKWWQDLYETTRQEITGGVETWPGGPVGAVTPTPAAPTAVTPSPPTAVPETDAAFYQSVIATGKAAKGDKLKAMKDYVIAQGKDWEEFRKWVRSYEEGRVGE